VTLRRVGAIALLLAGSFDRLAAQGPVIVEWGAHGTVTLGEGARLGLLAGPRLALRTLGGTRLAVSLGAGLGGDSASARGEAAVEYQLSPRAARGAGVYFGGGLAGVVGAGRGGYLLLYVGLEGSPGLPRGWAVEAGLGGGFRIRGAYHWRRFPPGWRPAR
jgi:hypothetical protein